MGDALGDLVVAPFLLTWSGAGALTAFPRRTLEVAALAVVAVGVSSFLFLVGPPLDPAPVRQAYILFPLLIWAAIRFGPRGGTATILVISVFAIWGTLLESGPFASETLGTGLLKLQLFMGVATVTTLVLAAVSAERMEALKAEEEILAIVSHDMKNPLGALRLTARRLLKQPPTELGPDARRQGEFIARCAHRLESLIANVLDGATIRAGHLSLQRAPQDLAALITDAAETLGPMLEEKSQTFRLEAPPAVRVDVDRERMLQVLSNLLGNACQVHSCERTHHRTGERGERLGAGPHLRRRTGHRIGQTGPGLRAVLERRSCAGNGTRAVDCPGHRRGARGDDVGPERARSRHHHRIRRPARLRHANLPGAADAESAVAPGEARLS